MNAAEAASRLQGYAATLADLIARAEHDLAAHGALGAGTRDGIREFVSALSADLSTLYERAAAGRLSAVERDVLLPTVAAIRAQLRGSAGFKEPSSALTRLRSAIGLTAPDAAP